MEAGEASSVLGLKGMFAAFVTGFEQHPGLFSRQIQRMKAAPGVYTFAASLSQDWECSNSVFSKEKGLCQLSHIVS